MKLDNPGAREPFLSDVRQRITRRTADVLSGPGGDVDVALLMPGKMLRTRLAWRLAFGDGAGPRIDPAALVDLCAATEMVHTASLCHDDVVDNSMLRRSVPTLWRSAGSSAAILVGDLLLCEAMDLVMDADGGRLLRPFVAKVREVVEAEAEQELLWRGKRVDEPTCVRLARGKTGALFAFVAEACGGTDEALSAAMAEAGYRVGTAYQLADDLLDLVGSEKVAGKTLGTDAARDKFTLPQGGAEGGRRAREHVRGLCAAAREALGSYPDSRRALTTFLQDDLQPVLERHLDASMELAV